MVGVKSRLQFAKGLGQLRTEQSLIERGVRVAVAVLAGKAASQFEDEFGDRFRNASHLLNTFSRLQVDHRAKVETSRRSVGIPLAKGPMGSQDPIDLADIAAEQLHRNSDVFDEGDRFGIARHRHQQAEPGLAHLPQVSLRLRRLKHPPMGGQRFGGLLEGRQIRAGVFDDQQRFGNLIDKGKPPGIGRHGTRPLKQRSRQELNRRGFRLQQPRRTLGRLGDAVEWQHHDDRVARLLDQFQTDPAGDGQRPLGATQHRGKIERVPWRIRPGSGIPGRGLGRRIADQVVEPIARRPPPCARPMRRYRLGVITTQIQHGSVNLTLDPASRRGSLPRGYSHRAEGGTRAIAQDDIDAVDVVGGHAVPDRMGARGVVAHHPPYRRPVRRCRIWPVLQAVDGGRPVQGSADDTRLDFGNLRLRIDRNNRVEVLRAIHDYSRAEGLSRQSRASAPGDQRQPEFFGRQHGRVQVLFGLGDNDAQRANEVIGGIGAVERPRKGIETRLALKVRLEGSFQINQLGRRGFGHAPLLS